MTFRLRRRGATGAAAPALAIAALLACGSSIVSAAPTPSTASGSSHAVPAPPESPVWRPPAALPHAWDSSARASADATAGLTSDATAGLTSDATAGLASDATAGLTSGATAGLASDATAGTWELRFEAAGSVVWDNNVFKLSPSQLERLRENDSASVVSRRFRDMRSASDAVARGRAELSARRDRGLFGGRLTIAAAIDHRAFVENPEKTFTEFELDLAEDLSKRSRLSLGAVFAPSVFARNYFADAVDPTGNVSRAERIYRPGVYDEWEGSVGVRQRLADGGEVLRNVTAEAALRYRTRHYDPPHGGRNEQSFRGGLAIEAGLTKRAAVDIGYLYEPVSSPVTREVLVLDEAEFDRDFNGDGDRTDRDRRTVQPVDRSHRVHIVRAGAEIEYAKDGAVELRYEYRWKNFTSTQPIDPEYRGGRDRRWTIEAGVRRELSPRLEIRADFERALQTTNRRDDPDDISDYGITSVTLGLRFRLK